MSASASQRRDLHTALAAPAWAWRFYLDHFPLIAGLSLIPAAERFVGRLWGEQLSFAGSAWSESLTTAVRLVLLYLVVRTAIGQDPVLGPMSSQQLWANVTAFFRARWLSLVIQAALLAAGFLLFDVVPGHVVPRFIDPDRHSLYWAILLAVKNPTVIAFYLIWMVAIARQMMLPPQPAPSSTRSHPQ